MDFNKTYDVLFLHGYWLSVERDGGVGMTTRGKLVTNAAGLLFSQGIVKNIVVTVGHIWGNEYPSGGELMRSYLMKNFNVPEEKIILQDTAFDTGQEVDTFLSLLKKYNWNSILDMAAGKHLLIIKKLFRTKGPEVPITFINLEEVILEFGDEETKTKLKKFLKSIYEFNFLIYEILIRLYMIIDPNYKYLNKRVNKNRNKKKLTGITPYFLIDEGMV